MSNALSFLEAFVKTLLTFPDVKSNFALLDRAVAQFDSRFTLRALRSISSLRKRLSPEAFIHVISSTYPKDAPSARTFYGALGVTEDQVKTASSLESTAPGTKQQDKEIIPEIDVYIGILVQVRHNGASGCISRLM